MILETEALFYSDIAFDLIQLAFFHEQHLWDYFLLNAIGLLAPPVSTGLAAFRWLQQESRELQHLRGWLPSRRMQVAAVLILIASQTHMLFLVLFSAGFRLKPGSHFTWNSGSKKALRSLYHPTTCFLTMETLVASLNWQCYLWLQVSVTFTQQCFVSFCFFPWDSYTKGKAHFSGSDLI